MQNHQPTILVVDDNGPIRITLRKGLNKAGYIVQEASNGEQGLAKFIEHQPDVVLMDVQMPIMNGFESVKGIRKSERKGSTPILMLTADDDVDSIRNAFDAGATDYITKPINLPLLLLRLKFALRDIDREKKLKRSEQQKENARQLFGLVYWEIETSSGRIDFINNDVETLSWLKPQPETFNDFVQFVFEQDRKRFLADCDSAMENNRPFDLELKCKTNDGIHFVRLVGQQGETSELINGAIQDITEQKNLEDRTSYLNFYDQITGLPNQKLFLSSLEKAIQQSRELNFKTVVLALEIDNLNAITNAYGNTVTETLLSRVAAEIKAIGNDNAISAKLDAGYFALKLRYQQDESLESIARAMNEKLSKIPNTWMINGNEIFVKYAAGIAEDNADEDASSSTLLRKAKSAQVSAQTSKNISIVKYDDKLNIAMKRRLDLEAELHKALENKEFKLQYQPQLCLMSGKVVGAEALLRWHSNERGFVSPGEFIPVLEESGLITSIGETIVSRACRQQLNWQKKGLEISVGINISAIQFRQQDLSERICAIADKSGVNKRNIELEVTESATMDEPERAMEVLQALSDAGFKIALDDFGTGYASFEYLLNFQLDKIKIDRAFIRNITQNRKDRALVKAISSLSDGLNIRTIAEGVEDTRQKDYLDALGIQEIQGYLISKPLWPEELYKFAMNFNQ